MLKTLNKQSKILTQNFLYVCKFTHITERGNKMGIGKIGAKLYGLFAKTSGKGKLIGTSTNNIQVFRKTAKDGTVVTKSYKDGKLFKSIEKTPLKEDFSAHYNPHINTGYKTVVKNSETGITTNVKNVKADYKRKFEQYNVYFTPGVRNEFSVSKIGANGKDIYSYSKVSSPDFFTNETVQRFNNGIPYYHSSTNKTADYTEKMLVLNGYKMPNGSLVTGEFGRKTYLDPFTNTVKQRSLFNNHEIAVTQNSKGETIVKSGYNIMWFLNM